MNMGVFRKHRDHNLSVIAEIRDGCCDFGAGCGELFRGFGNDVIYGKIMPAAHHAVGHTLAHTSQADEANLHAYFSRPLDRPCSRATTAQSFSPSPCAMAPSRRSRNAFPLGSGTRARSAASMIRLKSLRPSSVVNPTLS